MDNEIRAELAELERSSLKLKQTQERRQREKQNHQDWMNIIGQSPMVLFVIIMLAVVLGVF